MHIWRRLITPAAQGQICWHPMSKNFPGTSDVHSLGECAFSHFCPRRREQHPNESWTRWIITRVRRVRNLDLTRLRPENMKGLSPLRRSKFQRVPFLRIWKLLEERSVVVYRCTMHRLFVSKRAKQPFSVTISQPVVSGRGERTQRYHRAL